MHRSRLVGRRRIAVAVTLLFGFGCRSTSKQPENTASVVPPSGQPTPGPTAPVASVPGTPPSSASPPAPSAPALPPQVATAAITLTAVTDTTLRASWTPAVDPATPAEALSYQIFVGLEPNLSGPTAAALAASGSSAGAPLVGKSTATLVGLAPDTTYYLNIAVTNAAGLSVTYTQAGVHSATNTGGLDRAGYAAQCAYRLGSLKAFNCMDGQIGPITINGTLVGPGLTSPQVAAWSLDGSHGQPKCDRPPLLDTGDSIGHCVPFSRFGRLASYNPDGTVRSDVDTVFSCRHYRPRLSSTKWNGEEFGSFAQVPVFEDIAILQHNRVSGETCWFQMLREGQTSTPTARVYIPTDGRRVPPPTEGALPAGSPAYAMAAAQFWLGPQQTAAFNCGLCHDSGTWKHSPYIDQVLQADGTTLVPSNLLGASNQRYSMLGAQAFGVWPKTQAVTAAPSNDSNGKSCTSCHVLGNQRTCSFFLPYSVGHSLGPNATASGSAWPLMPWMPPPDPALTSLSQWQQSGYLAAANHQQTCCATPEAAGCSLTPLATPPLPYLGER